MLMRIAGHVLLEFTLRFLYTHRPPWNSVFYLAGTVSHSLGRGCVPEGWDMSAFRSTHLGRCTKTIERGNCSEC